MEVSGQFHAPATLTQERAPGTHWIGGWVGPRAVLDAVVKKKIPSLRRESNPRTPIIQPAAQRVLLSYHRLKLSQQVEMFQPLNFALSDRHNQPIPANNITMPLNRPRHFLRNPFRFTTHNYRVIPFEAKHPLQLSK
jgi:hypothetical protein